LRRLATELGGKSSAMHDDAAILRELAVELDDVAIPLIFRLSRLLPKPRPKFGR
jgi:hypothetical protein